jgi:hypothetical protein
MDVLLYNLIECLLALNTFKKKKLYADTGTFFMVKRTFINPICHTWGASMHTTKKQVLSTWVYIRCPQVGGCEMYRKTRGGE